MDCMTYDPKMTKMTCEFKILRHFINRYLLFLKGKKTISRWAKYYYIHSISPPFKSHILKRGDQEKMNAWKDLKSCCYKYLPGELPMFLCQKKNL